VTQDYPPEWRAGAAIRDLLEPGERLLWQGAPDLARRPANPNLLSAMWACWVLSAGLLAWSWSGGGAPAWTVVASLVGAVMLSVGAWLSTMRFPRHHAYAVTDRRILLLRGRRRGVHVQVYRPRHVPPIRRHENADGTTDIIVHQGSVDPPSSVLVTVLRAALPAIDAIDYGIDGMNPVGFQYLRDHAPALDALTALFRAHAVAAARPPWDGSAPDREATP
jgi:hypothetical protein